MPWMIVVLHRIHELEELDDALVLGLWMIGPEVPCNKKHE